MIVENIERTTDTVRTEPGVRRGMRRVGTVRRVRMPVFDRFPAADSSAARLIAMHGIVLERTRNDCTASAQMFAADSVIVSPTAFQNRRNVRVDKCDEAMPLAGFAVAPSLAI